MALDAKPEGLFRTIYPISGYVLVWCEDFHEMNEQLDGKSFNIFLEVFSNRQASKMKEAPLRRPRTRSQRNLSGVFILQLIHQLAGCAA